MYLELANSIFAPANLWESRSMVLHEYNNIEHKITINKIDFS